MPVTSNVSEDGRELSIKVNGRFDFSLHQSFREAYKNAEAQLFRYKVDLSKVDYIDSAALGMLLVFRERVGGDSAKIRITGCGNDVRKLMEVSNFHKLFQIEETRLNPE